MKYLKFIFATILGMFLIVSCGDEAVAPDTQNQAECFGFTQAEMATIGTLHNNYVTEVYQNVDFLNCDACADEVIAEFANLDVDLSGYGKTQEELIAGAELLYVELELIQFDLRNWQDHPFSPESYVHLTTIMEKMDVMGNYQDFITDMNDLQAIIDADVSLSCFDVELLTGTIEVAKSSAFLWLPRENGGLDFYSTSQEGKVELRWSWGRAAQADVASSAAFFMTMGVGGALGLLVPGSNAVIATGWALSTAIGSALGGL
jgi:hypothetical protein